MRMQLRTVIKQLAEFYHRNGYVRRQDARRYRKEGHRLYKKGDEIRLVADSKRELQTIRRLLKQAGFKPGRPFVHYNQYRQPLYGRDAVARFLSMIGEE
ncbi:MAG: hypothetical protein ABIH23_31730 [bacterium]